MSPEISIIIPVYNSEHYLERCINSVLSQTFGSYEIILVDDGSLDGSGLLCDQFSSSNDKITTIHQKNGGVSSARNTGIANARGEWVCFVDSDDYVEPYYLENFSLDNRDVDLVAQGYKIIEGENETLVGIPCSEGLEMQELFYALEAYNILNSPCFKLFKRDIICKNQLLFNHCLSYGEDHLFTLQYMQYVNNVSYQDGHYYVYVHHEGNNSLTTRIVSPQSYLLYLDKIVPMIIAYSMRFGFSEEERGILVNKRVHFHILRALINYSKYSPDLDLLNNIKGLLRNCIIEEYGLTNNQIIFVKIISIMNSRVLDSLLRINNKLEITKRIKIGF